jgi:starch phosphorylase
MGERGIVPTKKSISSTRRTDVAYDDLLAVALNLRWTWKIEARRLFARLDPDASPGALEWPHQLLRGLGRSRIREILDADPELAAMAEAVVENFAINATGGTKTAKTWFRVKHRKQRDITVAFFAAEFALTDSLPIFAGGLGSVAAEQLKAASTLGIPLIGVGLLYRGTSHQWLDRDGRQHESWDMTSPSQMPIELVRDAQGRGVQVAVSLPGRDIQVALYRAAVGRSTLYLLDTAVDSNTPQDQAITARLYDNDVDTRLAQQLVLGVGGVRALAAVGIEPDIVHINEGYSSFAVLERIRRVMAREGLSFAEAREAVRPSVVFTTHTPVAAGHDYFAPAVALRFLSRYAGQLGVEPDTLLALGRYVPSDPSDSFCPTIFAMRLAGHRNGVSRLHGRVTREQWSGLWPRLPTDEVPIGHVTNGVHLQSWTTSEFHELLTTTLGSQWRTTPGDHVEWSKLDTIDDKELWRAKNVARSNLVQYTRRRARQELARRHALTERVLGATLLNPDALTIGFVGRFVAYKRPTLLLTDPDRLARLLSDPQRPIQIVFAGKAHPADEGGKALLQSMMEFADEYDVQDRVVFIVDFDTTMDRALAQGVDIWLNTPRRPLEACGVGGMKAGMNGVLNFSTLDGWWDEACLDADPAAAPIGFSIGTAGPYADEETQDLLDAKSLYDVLEHEIAARFYDRDDDDVPRSWIASVKRSMSTLAPTGDSLRMTREYTESYYLPGVARARELSSAGALLARVQAREKDRLRINWPALRIGMVDVAEAKDRAFGTVEVHLGELDPTDLQVQLWVVRDDIDPVAIDTVLQEHTGSIARYATPFDAADVVEVIARVVPATRHSNGEAIPGLITWSQ